MSGRQVVYFVLNVMDFIKFMAIEVVVVCQYYFMDNFFFEFIVVVFDFIIVFFYEFFVFFFFQFFYQFFDDGFEVFFMCYFIQCVGSYFMDFIVGVVFYDFFYGIINYWWDEFLFDSCFFFYFFSKFQLCLVLYFNCFMFNFNSFDQGVFRYFVGFVFYYYYVVYCCGYDDVQICVFQIGVERVNDIVFVDMCYMYFRNWFGERNIGYCQG